MKVTIYLTYGRIEKRVENGLEARAYVDEVRESGLTVHNWSLN